MKCLGILAAVVFMLCTPNRGRAQNCARQVLSFNAPLSLSLPVAALHESRVFVQPLVVDPLAIRSYTLPLQASLQPQRIVVRRQRRGVAVGRRRASVRRSQRRRPSVSSRLIIIR